MSPENLLGIVIGGIIPAFLFATSSIFAKAAVKTGISNSIYMSLIGISVLVVGVLLYFFNAENSYSLKGIALSICTGFSWALGATFFAFAMMKFGTPVSKLVPIHTTAALFAVLTGFYFFSEWQQVHTIKLLLGTLLIISGAVLVSNS